MYVCVNVCMHACIYGKYGDSLHEFWIAYMSTQDFAHDFKRRQKGSRYQSDLLHFLQSDLLTMQLLQQVALPLCSARAPEPLYNEMVYILAKLGDSRKVVDCMDMCTFIFLNVCMYVCTSFRRYNCTWKKSETSLQQLISSKNRHAAMRTWPYRCGMTSSTIVFKAPSSWEYC